MSNPPAQKITKAKNVLPFDQGMPDASSCAGGELREIAVLRSQSVVARNTQQCLHIAHRFSVALFARALEISSE
jgi:hypothetical protein